MTKTLLLYPKYSIVRNLFIVCLLLLFHAATAQKKKLVAVGFYNLENYYDTLNDPNINDEDFTPNGANAYTGEVFKKKVENLTSVIEKMAMEKTDEGLAILGVAEIEAIQG